MIQDQIRYDILVQDALRSVIRKVLSEVAQAGLPGDHHFFITFATNVAGVKLSPRLKARYPEKMTIVIQRQYKDLYVGETSFDIGLSFDHIMEKLTIPFHAIQVFCDPAASFETAFDLPVEPAMPTVDAPVLEADSAVSLPEEKSTTGADIVSLDAFRKNK
ncbi:SspB family protein [Bartonella sp. DGB2]|uniref:SspB family protein n=1 Tax=Bartonella sp. DGB2 TaxID=3388426 RepID=UPI00398FA868